MRRANLFAILLIILLSSCTVTEEITLDNSTVGKIKSDIKVEDFFVTVLEDFSEFLPPSNETILDGGIKDFTSQLGSSKYTTFANSVETEENHYLIEISFSDLTALVTELSGGQKQSILTIKDKSLNFFVDINNYVELKTIVPFLADPNFEVFLPEYNIGYTEEEYLEMIVFLLGEEAPEKILSSNIKVRVQLPTAVTTLTNCKKVNTNTIEYEFRLIDFLLLSKPLSFSVSFK